jgi:hypothetical protein
MRGRDGQFGDRTSVAGCGGVIAATGFARLILLATVALLPTTAEVRSVFDPESTQPVGLGSFLGPLLHDGQDRSAVGTEVVAANLFSPTPASARSVRLWSPSGQRVNGSEAGFWLVPNPRVDDAPSGFGLHSGSCLTNWDTGLVPGSGLVVSGIGPLSGYDLTIEVRGHLGFLQVTL